MFKRKYLMILLLSMLLVCAVTQVNAADEPDNNLTDTDFEQPLSEVSENENLTSEIGTYTDLDNLLYDYYDVTLDKDYAYDSEKDSDLHNGVKITHSLILNGNNHTIYANGARFFSVFDVEYASISNLNFVNIYSPEFLENYDGNAYYYGGGIINTGGLYLENCTFINNFAFELGGAILSADNSTLYVENCNFVNNSVLDYMASGETTYGGAICSYGELVVGLCNFYNSNAENGGAIATFNIAYIWYSNFENNNATRKGGAIYNHLLNSCDVYNCTFKANVAAYGGAVNNAIATDCYFYDDNYATTKKGHCINTGVNINCKSQNNNSENYYDVINSKAFAYEPLRLIYNRTGDEKLEILVKSNPNGETVPGIQLNLRFEDSTGNYRYYLLTSDENGIASFPLSDFVNGTYKISIFFVNNYYNNTVKNYTLILGKVQSKIIFSTSIIFEYNSVGYIYFNVDGGTIEKKNIEVVNHKEAKIGLSGSTISISGLKVGKYTLRVISTPNENYLPGKGEISFTVKKATAVIKASKITVALKKGTLWTIKLVDSKNNKPISKMELTLKVYTGKKYKTVKGVTNSKGELKYKTSGLSKGTHKIVVSGKHAGYNFNTLKSSIKVIKPKALTFKLHKRQNDKNGALISYIVKDKKTKKGINGIKIKLQIYTGKKIKTITVKTKRSGKYNGAMGLATNELSVGKHKVIITPASIKYSGKAKTTMIIKKQAAKKQKYTHKL